VAVAVIAGTVIAVIVSAGSTLAAAGQFNQAYASFHSRFATEPAALNSHLKQAGNGFGDPSFTVATSDAKDLASLYHTYAKSVAAISMPASAKPGAARLVQVANAGQFLMSQAGDFFTKSGMQAMLDADWPLVTRELTKAESRVRQALGIAT